MRLYLSAESKNNIGYTPDWLKVHYKENGQDCGVIYGYGKILYRKF